MRCLVAAAASVWLLVASNAASQPPAPESPASESPASEPGAREAADVHLGVGSCASAPCHGRAGPAAGTIARNEHTTWIRHHAHPQAFASLRSDRSRRIARNLGLGPADEAEACLVCHADWVPVSRRGERFQLEDGVGCEACHGGSERWIEVHVAGRTPREELVRRGLIPTDDPVARAELCLSCHLGEPGEPGHPDRFVDHRMFGAGHPRLSFELDTFSQIQPAHHRLDEDTLRRGKVAAPSAVVWAVGQLITVRSILSGLADPARRRDGVWPEFAFFDCHACHHPMDPPRWKRRDSTGAAGRPGTPRLDDSSFLMSKSILAAVDPARAAALGAETLRLHAALSSGSGDLDASLVALTALVGGAVPIVAAWSPDAASLRQVMRGIVAEGRADEYRDYAGAEQATMALQALASSLGQLGAIAPEPLRRLDQALQQLLATTEQEASFRPASFAEALGQLAPLLQAPES